jgi:tyrosyl-tRNA synthetase
VLDPPPACGLVAGKGAARRAVAEGGAHVDNTRIADAGRSPTETDLLPGNWLVVRCGKRATGGVRAR